MVPRKHTNTSMSEPGGFVFGRMVARAVVAAPSANWIAKPHPSGRKPNLWRNSGPVHRYMNGSEKKHCLQRMPSCRKACATKAKAALRSSSPGPLDRGYESGPQERLRLAKRKPRALAHRRGGLLRSVRLRCAPGGQDAHDEAIPRLSIRFRSQWTQGLLSEAHDAFAP